MRKKISRLSTRHSKILPMKIVTFDNKDYCQSLFEPVPRKLCNFESFAKCASVLKTSAAQASTLCLANNQILQSQRMIAIHKHPIADEAYSNSFKWMCLQYNEPQDYEVFAEPEILYGQSLIEQHEESISFPFLNFYIQRYNKIAVKFKNEKNIREERMIEGSSAFAFQQSYQQLNGSVIFDWRINHGKMFFQKQASAFFPKSSAIIEEYVKDLKEVFDEYPELIAKKQKLEGKESYPLQDESLPFENDYLRRLIKHFSREMDLLPAKLQSRSSNNRVWKEQSLNVKIIKE